MTLSGRVTYHNDPMHIAVQGMTTQIHLLKIHTDNIAFADIPGYQKKAPVITSFTQFMGKRGISKATNTEIGRIHKTDRPLDLALASKGYFQVKLQDGQVKLTRDGRFRLDEKGNLLSIIGEPVLSKQGVPIRLAHVPADLKEIKIHPDGWIEALNPETGKIEKMAQVGVASEDGTFADEVHIRQGFSESSNVFLHEEYVGIVPAKRNFQANRQVFLIQNQLLSKLIQDLGRAQ